MSRLILWSAPRCECGVLLNDANSDRDCSPFAFFLRTARVEACGRVAQCIGIAACSRSAPRSAPAVCVCAQELAPRAHRAARGARCGVGVVRSRSSSLALPFSGVRPARARSRSQSDAEGAAPAPREDRERRAPRAELSRAAAKSRAGMQAHSTATQRRAQTHSENVARTNHHRSARTSSRHGHAATTHRGAYRFQRADSSGQFWRNYTHTRNSHSNDGLCSARGSVQWCLCGDRSVCSCGAAADAPRCPLVRTGVPPHPREAPPLLVRSLPHLPLLLRRSLRDPRGPPVALPRPLAAAAASAAVRCLPLLRRPSTHGKCR